MSSVVLGTLACPRCGYSDPFPMSADAAEDTGIVCDGCGEVYTVERRKTVPPFLLRALQKNQIG